MTGEVRLERLQRFEHMLIAEVPGRNPTVEHHPVVFFSVLRDTCVLFGVEVLVVRGAAIEAYVLFRTAAKFQQRLHDLGMARLRKSERDGVTVVGRVGDFAEAAVVTPRSCGCGGIDSVEIRYYRLDRALQAVKVQAVEADPTAKLARLVEIAQPADEVEDVGIAPHPGRQFSEARERIDRVGIGAPPGDVAADAQPVRPVGLDGDRGKSELVDQSLGDLATLAIELVGSVGGFADHDDARAADVLNDCGIAVVGVCERAGGSALAQRRHARCRRRQGPARHHDRILPPFTNESSVRSTLGWAIRAGNSTTAFIKKYPMTLDMFIYMC